MIQEIWTRIPGYPDYRISILGRIKRIRIAHNNQRWKAGHIKKLKTQGRYLNTSLHKGIAHKQDYVHRLVLLSFVGQCPPSCECNHKDGNKLNNRLDNLEWTTHSKNELHAYKNGLKKGIGCPGRIGELHPLHKLKNGEVWLIKKILASKRIAQIKIAEMFKVSQPAISKINIGKRWPHIVYTEPVSRFVGEMK